MSEQINTAVARIPSQESMLPVPVENTTGSVSSNQPLTEAGKQRLAEFFTQDPTNALYAFGNKGEPQGLEVQEQIVITEEPTMPKTQSTSPSRPEEAPIEGSFRVEGSVVQPLPQNEISFRVDSIPEAQQ